MLQTAIYAAALGLGVHGLIHFMGFANYWQLAEFAELPYKTTLFNGQWDVGSTGIRVVGSAWGLIGIAFLIVTYGFVTEQDWWQPAMIVTVLGSLLLTGLDWDVAYAGVVINLLILAAMLVVPEIERAI
jgi:hypothetical protein